MTKVTYSVAMSLDGYIAREDGSFDWIPMDSTIDWDAFLDRFDTVVMGRKTYEATPEGGLTSLKGMEVFVCSQSILHDRVKGAHLVSGDPVEAVRQLRSEDRKGIWLMGGGALFRTLLDASQVDAVEVAVVPIILGGGISFLPEGGSSKQLELVDIKRYQSGIVLLAYDVKPDPS
jgi:dihydrofolate reductase